MSIVSFFMVMQLSYVYYIDKYLFPEATIFNVSTLSIQSLKLLNKKFRYHGFELEEQESLFFSRI